MGVAVLDGKMYAVGGNGGTYCLSSVDCFDPSTGQWSMMPAAMNMARSDMGVAVLDGKMYAVGGHDGVACLSSMECFDPSTGQWSMMPVAMSTARFDMGVRGLMGRCMRWAGMMLLPPASAACSASTHRQANEA